MKRAVSITLIAVILLLAAAPLVSADAGTTMVVNSSLGLSLREKAGLGQPLVAVMLNGETVTLLQKSIWKQGIEWAKVEFSRYGYTYTGFCAAAYLKSYGGYPEPIDSWDDGEGWKVTSLGGLRLRSGAGLAHYAVRIVPYGTILKPTNAATVVADGYTWRQLKYGGAKVWAAQEMLQHVGGE
ncbi:MAG: SH3 domain-containing protein [Chloroflexi bacterium]|jgi:hypothetical protein|nr:SH3 domain-containing protein [Chloroflexota bacterium]